jgi:hypothetical protein
VMEASVLGVVAWVLFRSPFVVANCYCLTTVR